ncbi:hypothetical protein TPHA_0D02040 [Tetrapisispora phaffii CBS 4417]|uniref:tRNA (guanine(37)-N1)-methyltransferase n=1 Tax=Tetrapisispora phaffii (strain ATCC 24235 / CBS 4417 / NBRC 1672 / NRRL Y-8282 / UCD 70-5) TaxID=1071381 RepID=G8BSM1_TETPH|nr:hypothetical protein TPHA_0D02040 [Tetrapisispora phaffii CBS 4417]CCE62842.1 hypothetical protein TPHA_0D02040 [Tetrapisispora phaffii CBS 4417]
MLSNWTRKVSIASVKYNQIVRNSTMSLQTMFKYSPPVDRNMKVLDRSYFVTKIPLCVVKFSDPRNISVFAKDFKSDILRIPRIPHVVKLDKEQGLNEIATQSALNENKKVKTLACDNGIIPKGVLLNESIKEIKDIDSKLSPGALEFLKTTNAEILPYEYILDYDFWKSEEILRSVLPEEFLDEIPTGFTITGHVAHLNLRKEFKPFDALIGQVILDKNNKIECVVDKVSSIATKFRTFPMKIIAGTTDNLVVEQKESNCTFSFDFSKVYWNSRLHTEHDRLVTQYFKPEQVICDVFGGVGPFSIPAGKKECIVLANDLNPESYKYLLENIRLNKVEELVKPFNCDGGEFITESVKFLNNLRNETDTHTIKVPIKRSNNNRKKIRHKAQTEGSAAETVATHKDIQVPLQIHHYIMNLPDSAIEFLGRFNGVFDEFRNLVTSEEDVNEIEMPWVHVHCFEKYGNDETELSDEEIQGRVHDRIIKSLNTTKEILPVNQLNFHLVRKVSPTKPMFCVSFKLPKEIAYTKYNK